MVVIGIQITQKVDWNLWRFKVLDWFFIFWLIFENFKAQVGLLSRVFYFFNVFSSSNFVEIELFDPKTKGQFMPG